MTVKENEWFYYQKKAPPGEDQEPQRPIEEGTYYVIRGARFSDMEKKRFSPKAASNKSGQFVWLLPAERWIKQYLDRFIPPENTIYGKVNLQSEQTLQAIADETSLPLSTIKGLRRWQRAFVADGIISLEKLGSYRRAVRAPLSAGKTLGALVASKLCKTPLVVAPAYLHSEWKDEAKKWGFPALMTTTYQSAYKFMAKGVDGLIMDEVLCVKNPLAAQTRKIIGMSEQMKVVIGLTGTPTSVSPMDLRWLNAIFPGCLPTDEKNWKFLWGLDTELKPVPGQVDLKSYNTTKWDMDGINKFIAPYMMVVDDKEIEAELPEITFKRYYVRQPKEYAAILAGAATEAGKSKALSQARQCSDGFVDNDIGEMVEFNEDKIEVLKGLVENSDQNFLVACNWTNGIARLEKAFAHLNPSILRGGADYEEQINRFKNGQTRMMIVNSRIVEGMNLQEVCDIVVVLSNCCYPVKRKQLIGRIRRAGQKSKHVTVIDIMAENTLDEVTLNLLNAHTDQSEEFVESAIRMEFERQVAAK